MNKEELGRLYPIIVVPSDPTWTTFFEREKTSLIELLGTNITLSIEHIGSTAVPNLSAKPTIDILVKIPQISGIEATIKDIMGQNNYIYMKEQKNHLMFVKGYTPTGLEKTSYHIHMGTKEQDFLWDRLYFRDYLRDHPSVAREYEELKMKLAIKYKYDREAYTESKTEFIQRITALAKAEKAVKIN